MTLKIQIVNMSRSVVKEKKSLSSIKKKSSK